MMETTSTTINNNYRSEEKKDYFEIDGDKIIRYKPVGYSDNYYSSDVVMDKETFIEAYKKWILGDEDNGEND
jgi:hypothetical protein